ncbi:MAG: adenylosuccinate synthase [Planctomycetota bacterium]|jgi:adenylosuccinate synthase|nr:adenylosuccinate synthase [Planctomycetota bacterium]MDP6990944.1 adenylosuccinate synthase [Planctomycetota bacterium]
MPSLSVFGVQWGDEGKGKIIDRLAADADVVVRYQGGANAGHTMVVDGEKTVLHLVPCGVLHPGTKNVVANGVAIDPIQLLAEVDGLRERGVEVTGETLRVSSGAHLIFEHHRQMDRLSEHWLGDGRIGTTGRGIGPAYADKASRVGLRVGDLLDPNRCRTRLSAALAEKNATIERVHGAQPLDLDAELESAVALGDRLRPFVGDTGAEVRADYRAGKRILFEGAQGIMLDIDHGTYPFVTSSNTGTAGIPAGAGFPPGHIDRAIGIAKAYCTRVGEGPFPSELAGEVGEAIRAAGNEYGATTGRPRRCGWFDAVAVRYGLALNGADGWVMTNLDVLSGFDELSVATAYVVGGELTSEYPSHPPALDDCEVRYETRPGWEGDISGLRRYEDLPENARAYVEWVEELVGTPIVMLSIGPDREQVISRGL